MDSLSEIICGDCLEVMRGMGANSVDAIVTDPPYGLKFMGKSWDHGLPGEPFWAEALRVAKPGCHLLAFGGTRTFHRLTCAIEDAGWEIRDCLGYLYGSGFPKSHRPSLDYERELCEKRGGKWFYKSDGEQMRQSPPFRSEAANETNGFGTALKPAWEPIILARKPLDGTVAANVQKWGTGAINVDGCRVEVADRDEYENNSAGNSRAKRTSTPFIAKADPNYISASSKGRWPANIITDGSDEVLELFPQANGSHYQTPTHSSNASFGGGRYDNSSCYSDSGSAARFFYCAKASRKEREAGLEGMADSTKSIYGEGIVSADHPGTADGGGDRRARNHHPTVKPVALMRYLCRLVTPPNGLILDPFCGSGSTGIAAKQEGFRFIGIDNNEEYCEIARKRIGT